MAGSATSSSNSKRADDGNSCHWVIKYGSKGDFPYPRTFFFCSRRFWKWAPNTKGKNNLSEPTSLRADKAKRINKKIHLRQKPGIHSSSSLRIATTVEYNESFFWKLDFLKLPVLRAKSSPKVCARFSEFFHAIGDLRKSSELFEKVPRNVTLLVTRFYRSNTFLDAMLLGNLARFHWHLALRSGKLFVD